MKISMISNFSVSGQRRHTQSLAAELERQGHEVQTISFQRLRMRNYSRISNLSILNYYYILLGKKGLFNTIDKFGPDIIHFHHPVSSADILVRKVKNRFDVPVVSTLHLAMDGSSVIDKLSKNYFRFVSKYISSADRVIAVSNFVKSSFLNISNTDESIVSTIYNGVDEELFRPNGHKKSDNANLLFVGRLSPEKGLSVLFKAFDIVQKKIDANLTIIGDGPLKIKCKMKAKSDKNVMFMGRVDENSLVNAYSSSTLLVFPSLWQEAFGLVLTEAMACCTPPVAFDVGAVPEVIDNNYNGFMSYGRDPYSLSEKLLDCMDSNLKKIGRNGRKTVLKKFTLKKAAKETMSVYESVL